MKDMLRISVPKHQFQLMTIMWPGISIGHSGHSRFCKNSSSVFVICSFIYAACVHIHLIQKVFKVFSSSVIRKCVIKQSLLLLISFLTHSGQLGILFVKYNSLKTHELPVGFSFLQQFSWCFTNKWFKALFITADPGPSPRVSGPFCLSYLECNFQFILLYYRSRSRVETNRTLWKTCKVERVQLKI